MCIRNHDIGLSCVLMSSSLLNYSVLFFKQKTAYEMRISDWSSDVCSSDLISVAVALDGKGRVIGSPALRTQGVPVEEDKAAFLEEAADEAAGAVAKGSQEEEALRERVRLAVRRTATRWTGKKPVVDVLLIRA